MTITGFPNDSATVARRGPHLVLDVRAQLFKLQISHFHGVHFTLFPLLQLCLLMPTQFIIGPVAGKFK